MSNSGVCSWSVTMRLMHGSIVLVTMPPWGFAIFFFIVGLFSTPGHTERDDSPSLSSWSTSYTFFATSFSSSQKQNDTFSQLLWTFSWVYWEKDNGCHNVVKTWTINSKKKSKKKNSLKSASLIEHFMWTLDWISVSLYISKALYSFAYKNLSLFTAKLKKYFCPS